ncbi:hypothetical protein PHJA_001395000 [Phtheirospermum japonicum]|uniref:Uncharacterized protein n=1 Tax=Phtheirospermum japonicum TaxID=374723 RepID=A0A830C5W8_9LAMI|nr:hypothetical protein PHJA_001395000 [Phtheirospermum japonicum]
MVVSSIAPTLTNPVKSSIKKASTKLETMKPQMRTITIRAFSRKSFETKNIGCVESSLEGFEPRPIDVGVVVCHNSIHCLRISQQYVRR